LRKSEKRSIVLVVGFHRSGTSAITRVLNILGAQLPHKLLKPVVGNNELGFWESETIVKIHERILNSLGINWHSLKLIPTDWISSKEATNYVEELKSTLISEYGNSNLILVKDPRLCLFLPLWERVAQELNFEIKCVFQYRNPTEVVSSLKGRNGFTEVHATLLWLHYTLQAEIYSRSFNRTFVSYGDLLKDWQSVVRKIGKTLSINGLLDPVNKESQIHSFIDINMYHHRSNNSHDVMAKYLWISQTYQALMALNNGDNKGIRIINSVRKEYYASLNVILEYQKIAVDSQTRINELSVELKRSEFLSNLIEFDFFFKGLLKVKLVFSRLCRVG